MRFFATFLAFCLFAYFIVGCQQNTPVAEVATPSTVAVEAKQPAMKMQQEDEKKSRRADRLLSKAGDIFKKATESSGDGEGVSKDWILQQIQEATESGGDAIGNDVNEWANKMFDSLKDKGLTGAGDASEWVTEDIRNMNAFKYKVVKVSLDDLEALEDQLNHFGQLKWECYHVADRGNDTIMFFKKERRSLLKNIPMRDMMKLIPMMGNE